MNSLLYDIDIKKGEIGTTIRKGRHSYDLFDFGEKIQLWIFDENYNEKIIGEAEILFSFIETYKNIDKKLLKHIKFPDCYEQEETVTIIFYKLLKIKKQKSEIYK
ncbi:MAG: hypothetical protein M0R03_19575 [Novosphingobium sp.]|nr:hypothetical protein [Novosphingobium sp.]